MASKKIYDFEELVYRQVESDVLDYKSRMSWRTMSRAAKGKLLRHLIAFANTRGGALVIGVSENDSGVPENRTGVSEEDAASFDPTPVADFFNAHVEPPLNFKIERPEIDGKRYVIFIVEPFTELPHICCRGIENELQEGVFYIRTSGASSRPARRAMEMQQLLRRCMRNEREQLGRILRGILLESKNNTETETREFLPDQIDEAENFFRRRRSNYADKAMLKFVFTLENSGIDRKIMPADWQNAVPCCAGDFPDLIGKNDLTGREAPESVRRLSTEIPMMWQIFKNGTFFYFRFIEQPEIDMSELRRFTGEICALSGRLTGKLFHKKEHLNIFLSLSIPAKNISVKMPGSSEKTIISGNKYTAGIRREAALFAENSMSNADKLFRQLAENMQFDDSCLEWIEKSRS